jgi:2-oxoglutarate ferredoxin oxidoreductase subunit alpha
MSVSSPNLLNIDHGQIENSISKQFEGKTKAIDSQLECRQNGSRVGSRKSQKRRPVLRRTNGYKTEGKIIIDGNAACALGSLFAGVTVVSWYPITPSSSSLCEQLIDYLKEYRIDKETGKASFCCNSSRRRTGCNWYGSRRWLGWCSLDDVNIRPWHFAHG